MTIQETQVTFLPGFNKLALPVKAARSYPAGVQTSVAEPRTNHPSPGDPAARGTPLGRSLLGGGRGAQFLVYHTHTHPILALFPQQTCQPLSCQAKYFGLAGGRREPRGPSKPIRLGWGRGGRGGRSPCTCPGDTAACAASGCLGAERAPRDPGRLGISLVWQAPGTSLCPWGWRVSWTAFCSAPCVTFRLWGPSSLASPCSFLHPCLHLSVSSCLSLSVSLCLSLLFPVSCYLCVGFLAAWSLPFPSHLKLCLCVP